MICKNCGTEIEPNALFCTFCGAKVPSSEDQSSVSVYTDDAKQVYNNTVDENAANNIQMDNTPVYSVPVDETPVYSTPVNNTSFTGTPVSSTPVNSMPMGGASMNGMSMSGASMNSAPIYTNTVNANPGYSGMMNSNPMKMGGEDPLESLLKEKEGFSAVNGYALLSKKDFLNLPAFSKIKKKITGAAISVYVICAINLAAAIYLGNMIIPSIIIFAALGIAIQVWANFAASVALLAYSTLNCIYYIWLNHIPGGWYMIVCGILAVIYTYKLSQHYKRYKETGYIPNFPVA